MTIIDPPGGDKAVVISHLSESTIPRIAEIVPGTASRDAALAFYFAGFLVIPGHPVEKRSAVRWDPWLEALSPGAIAAHYADHPDHTLGFILDERVLVLDADSSLAVTALDILETKFGIVSNFVVTTRRGEHRYYRRRKGVMVRTNSHSTEDHPERIDIKAERSLVMLPPSPKKSVSSGDIGTIDDLVDVGQDFVDAVFRHNGCEPPRAIEQAAQEDNGHAHSTPSVALAELGAMLNQFDPDGSYDEWCRGLMVVHYETGGAESGFDLVNSWSRRGKKYCGERELRAKWRTFDGYAGKPVTAGTLRHLLAQRSSGPNAQPATKEGAIQRTPSTIVQVTPELVLLAFSLTGQLKQLKRMAQEQVHLLQLLALMGQATVFFAAPNTGKTLLVLWLLIEAIKAKRVDPSMVFYINCDDSLGGLIQKLELAEQYGFHMLAEGYQDFEARKFVALLEKLIANEQARGVVIVLDTLKKFTDLMDKRSSANFMTLVRRFVLKGGTAVLLAHTNKHPGRDGKPEFSGTTDVRDDVDCVYIMWAQDDPSTDMRVVHFENRKSRGDVQQQAAFGYRASANLSYLERLASVRPLDDAEAKTLQWAAVVRADDELVEVASACIADGVVKRMDLLAEIARRAKCSRREAQAALDCFTGDDPRRHRWTFDVQARGAKVYRLLTSGADSTEGTGHE